MIFSIDEITKLDIQYILFEKQVVFFQAYCTIKNTEGANGDLR